MPKKENILVLDLGTYGIKGLAVQRIADRYEVVAYAMVRTRGMDWSGLKDVVALRESIESVIMELEDEMGRDFYQKVRICFSDSSYAVSMDTKEVVLDSENPVEITQEIQEELLNNLGKESAFETDPTLMLHIFPMQYVIDDVKVVVNPLELEAKKLAVEAFTATVSASRFNTMNQLISEFLPAVDSEFVVPSLAAGYVVTTEAERERGVFVLDFGHSFVNVLGFVNSIPVFHETVPIGFRYVIKDVSRVLNTSISEAERIITSKGFASMNPPDPSEIVEYYALDGRTRRATTLRELAIIIYARTREILNKARRVALEAFSSLSRVYSEGVPTSVVITGGGAKLPGLTDTATDVFKSFVRIGTANTGSHIPIEGPDEVINNSAYSAVIGALTVPTRAGMATPEKRRKKKRSSILDFFRELFGWE